MGTYKDILKSDNFIDNQWVQNGTGDYLTVLDKYHNAELARVPHATEEQMEQAIIAAQKGFEEIRRWPAGKRQTHLERLTDLLREKREAFIDMIIKEGGKPKGYATAEIDRCLVTLSTAASETVRFSGETVPLDFGAGEGKTAFTKRFPIGVIACITPFNFPLNLLLHKVAPALAVGCSVIIKPAPQAPLSTLAFAELVKQAGYPAGVYNALACDIPVAEKMVKDDRIVKLSFTGSDKVGWYLKSISGKKKVTLELGGNAAVIIDESADIEKAAKTTAVGTFIYAGQVCISTQRIIVHETVYDEFVKHLVAETKALKTGDPNNSDTMVGPLIDRGHLNRIDEWVKEAVANGAEVLVGGNILNEENNTYEPTLLTNANDAMQVVCAEAFGPLAVIEKVKDFDEAIVRCNESNYGLQAGVYTNSFENFKKAHEKLEVGGVMINNVPSFRIDSMPYGGVKDSGLGREGIKYAMEEMTEGRLIVY